MYLTCQNRACFWKVRDLCSSQTLGILSDEAAEYGASNATAISPMLHALTCALTRPLPSYQKGFWTIRQRQDSVAKRLPTCTRRYLVICAVNTCTCMYWLSPLKSHAGDFTGEGKDILTIRVWWLAYLAGRRSFNC